VRDNVAPRQCRFGILAPRFDAVTVLFVGLALAHQEVVLGSLRWI